VAKCLPVYPHRATGSCVVLYACDRRQYVHTTLWKYISCVEIDVSLWRGSICMWHKSKWLPVYLYRATGDNVYIGQKNYRVYWKGRVYEHMTCVNMLACSPIPRDGQLCSSIICMWQVTLYTGNTLKVYVLCGDRRESVVAVWACDMWQYVCLFTCTARWAVV
jgi:hypothetical protein